MASEDKNGRELVPRDTAAVARRSAALIERGLAALTESEPTILHASCGLTDLNKAAASLLHVIQPIDPENDPFMEYVEIEASDGRVFLRAPGEFLRAQIGVKATVAVEGLVTLDLNQFPSFVADIGALTGDAADLKCAYLPPVPTTKTFVDDPDLRERSEQDVLLQRKLQQDVQAAGDYDQWFEAWKAFNEPFLANSNARLEVAGSCVKVAALVSTRRERAEWRFESSLRVWGSPSTWTLRGYDLVELVADTYIRKEDDSARPSSSLSKYLYVDLRASSVAVVATNGLLVLRAEVPASGDCDLHVLVFASDFLAAVSSLGATGNVEITTGESYGHLTLGAGDSRIEMARFEHGWRDVPDVRQVLPQTVLEQGTADRSLLIEGTKKKIEDGATQLMLLVSEGQAAIFGPQSLVQFDLTALSRRILVNPVLLLEILKNATESHLLVQICPMPPTASVECDAVVIRGADNPNRWFGMLMPLRASAQEYEGLD